MLFIDNLDPASLEFFSKLVDQSGGDPAVSISMYEIGTSMGLDKEGARSAAEDIIGRHLAEIVSLSGTIRLTENGVEGAEKLGLATAKPETQASGQTFAGNLKVPGTDRELRILGPGAVTELKELAARLVTDGPASDDPESGAQRALDLAGLIAQLGSPQPRAEVVLELLLSLAAVAHEGEARVDLIGWIEKLSD